MKTVAFFLLTLVAVTPVGAELAPDQVAIIAMAESPASRELARHYAQARKVPDANLLLLEGKPGDAMSRVEWETRTRPAIRKWLSQNGREDKIRCAVVCWDVPLTIGKREGNSPVVVERTELLSRARKSRVEQVSKLLDVLNGLGQTTPPSTTPPPSSPPKPAAASPAPSTAAAPSTPPATTGPLAADATVQDIASRFDAALRAARERLGAVTDEAKKRQASGVFDNVFVAIGGNAAILRIVSARPKGEEIKPEQAAPLAAMSARVQGIQQGLQSLNALPDTASRDTQMLNLIQVTDGLIGTLRWIDSQQESLRKNETQASFDSELSLVRWSEYPLSRGLPNLLYYGYDDAGGGQSVLVVARLAAPTLDLAKKLVDKAIAAEATGLQGKVYLDARGMTYDAAKSQPGSYDAYDQSLRDLAERLKQHTTLDVVLNNEAELFQPGKCPNAALYCGWYSLAKYVDAFDWAPGAIGYHLASAEATTLRTPGSKVWCNAMLEDGITATLGPVDEPFLASFPKPDDFFSLLLTGKYTLAEVYYRTTPLNSWVMVLVGDPLYNPFKKKPALAQDALPERLK
jgi:uncharacterized protein (TIGR03790 family)